MMHQNRRCAGKWMQALLLALVLFISFSSSMAEEEKVILDIQIVANPAELVEPGDVILNFTIENTSDTDAENVYLSSADGLLSEPVGRVNAGESQSFNRQHSVTADELSAGVINYTISHDDPQNPDGKINYSVSAQIQHSDSQPQVEFTRQFSSRHVEAGDTLNIIYQLRNTGNVTLNDLLVQDTLGEFSGRVEHLEAGESKTLISRVVITEDTVSNAALTYGYEGGEEPIVRALSEASIHIAQTDLELFFSAGASAFSSNAAQAVLTLTNNGSVDIYDVRVSDEIYGGIVAEGLRIPADGEAVEVTRDYPLRGEMRFQWKITGRSASGKEIEMTVSAPQLSAPVSENPFSELDVEAETLTPRIRRSGNVSVFVRIENPGENDIWDVTLHEETLGDVHHFEVIPGNGSISREFSFHIIDDVSYAFSISYTDAQGNQRSQSAAPVEFMFASDGVLPEGASSSFIEFTGKSIKIGGSSAFAALLISGCTVLLVLIVLLLVASRRARFERRVRIAAEKQRRKNSNAKGNTRPAKNKTKGR